MNFKRFSASDNQWHDVPYYIHKTDTDTIATLPAVLYPNGTTATVGLKGNTSQAGTPTPTTPIQPQECGERTGNLFDYSNVTIQNGAYINDNGEIITKDSIAPMAMIFWTWTPVSELTEYCMSSDSKRPWTRVYFYDSAKNFISRTDANNTSGTYKSFITPSNCVYVNFQQWMGNSPKDELDTVMLNTGSTALPYEPYGYKIPILSGGENLFDYPQDNYSTTINSVVWTIENGVIKGEGFTTSQGEQDCILVRKNGLYRSGNYPNYYSLNASTDMKLPAGTYTFSYIPITEPTMISSRPRLIIGHEGGRYTDETAKFVWNGDTFTVDSDDYVALALNTSNSIGEYEFGKFMLNRGSTALPYEPYNRTTTPIYLGEVPTTRKIKKLVLDGTENWVYDGGFYHTRVNSLDFRNTTNGLMCSHLPVILRDDFNRQPSAFWGRAQAGDVCLCISNAITTLDAFKSYLQQQYAAGTPVTVWYVLATPETAVVNEPLRKIGDYADTVSGITIPTIAGTNALSIGTTLQPSEVSVNYKGWHPVADVHEADNGAWT